MNDGLPQDVNEWPMDPHEILGIGRDASGDEIRRAYVALIRIYKPEREPEKFRRVREAYERADRFRNLMGGAFNEAPQTFQTSEGILRISFDGENVERAEPPHPTSSHSSSFQIGDASDGQLHSLYQKLLVERGAPEADAVTFARLHWLLFCHPQLEEDRQPIDWVFAGLNHLGFQRPLVAILENHIRVNHELALDPRCRECLAQPWERYTLHQFLRTRWRIATECRQPDIISKDIDFLRPLLTEVHFDAASWVRLLVNAAELLAWTTETVTAVSDLQRKFEDELAEFGDVQFEVASDLDRLDYLWFLHRVWRTIRTSPLKIVRKTCQIVPTIWQYPHGGLPIANFRQSIRDWSELISEHRNEAMFEFDEIQNVHAEDYRGSIIVDFLDDALETYLFREAPVSRNDETTVPRIQEFLGLVRVTSYANFRQDVLQFCVEEQIEPDDLIRIFSDNPEFQTIVPELSLLETLVGDKSWKLVYKAWQVSWI